MPEDDANPTLPKQGGVADQELDAIQVILVALKNLDAEARQRVIGYVFKRLGMAAAPDYALPTHVSVVAPAPAPAPGAIRADIRTLKEQKRPRSAVEMAVLVTYYLTELAPLTERKAEVTSADLSKYFKQAGYPLPKRTIKTLFDARSSGYLDGGSEQGSYKLNPVGYNLVTHVLPAGKKG